MIRLRIGIDLDGILANWVKAILPDLTLAFWDGEHDVVGV